MYMLSKPNGLPRADIPYVLKTGRRYALPEISMTCRAGGKSVPRFAFVVSTAVDKRAVKRNRARRLLREAVRHLLPNVKQGVDCVFIARRSIIGRDMRQVLGVVTKLLKMGHTLRD